MSLYSSHRSFLSVTFRARIRETKTSWTELIKQVKSTWLAPSWRVDTFYVSLSALPPPSPDTSCTHGRWSNIAPTTSSRTSTSSKRPRWPTGRTGRRRPASVPIELRCPPFSLDGTYIIPETVLEKTWKIYERRQFSWKDRFDLNWRSDVPWYIAPHFIFPHITNRDSFVCSVT